MDLASILWWTRYRIAIYLLRKDHKKMNKSNIIYLQINNEFAEGHVAKRYKSAVIAKI